ncbi:hypothetical protein Cdeb_00047 [Caldibacillus debilis GB1]|jgi:thioester reductase-like protein|uniref:Male sterility protein n=1 Tax=Caldibacillus debilis GB1 TaxID=1339248 RepID=A0A420VHE3_9BACI|nr:hypothetical protein Cdeb_00047 [Caldibacillus debilis GB1]
MKTFKTVFLTGATGLLGRALISRLKEYQVICLILLAESAEFSAIV